MKQKTVSCLAVSAVALVAPLVTASAEGNRFYLKADIGGTSTRDVELREYFGQAIAANSELELDPGVRLGFLAGYGLTDWLAAEVETGVTANSIENITGATRTDGSLAHVPFLLNLKLHVPDKSRFAPYVGAGVGLASTILTADDIQIGPTIFDGSAADTVFAWQAFAGVNFAVNEEISLGVEYRFFRADPATVKADDFIGVPPPSDRIRLGRSETHSLSIALKIRF